ncbi:MAG: hypothetical protein LQ339_008575 [Xanthoria mediterranea]|nr:MAG: hypothetical protein LQ339_008575 [Xanthoria mediterranea]
MSAFHLLLALLSILTSRISASPSYNSRPFVSFLARREAPSNTSTAALEVDLGYERYQVVADSSTGLNTFKGMRFAAPPTGSRRWQPPTMPQVNRDQLIPADALPERCPQSYMSSAPPGFNYTGSEDCLFLSVYAPPDSQNLPVLVFIHGGGYGMGQGSQDLSMIINANNQSFIGVAIQYRLGAFGFLSSDEIARFRLIFISSGATLLKSLLPERAPEAALSCFKPWLLAALSALRFLKTPLLLRPGFLNSSAQNNRNTSIFNCLVSKDTDTLQNASNAISGSARYGTWAFLPVTDGRFIQEAPSQQLLAKRVNGRRMLSGNNANEAPLFVAQDIVTEEDFVDFVRNTFPLFTDDDISRVLLYYPSTNASDSADTPRFATSGTSGATAVNVSTFGAGQQQRAMNLWAETAFVCPSYWLAEAFTNNDRVAFKYQYSVIPARPAFPEQGADFVKALRTSWGNFITRNDPSIRADIAAGGNVSSATGSSNPSNGLLNQANGAWSWPAYNLAAPYQVNFNQSGGVPINESPYPGTPELELANVTVFSEPGLRNDFSLVNAYTWEGGRGMRCDFWRSVAPIIPA